MAITRRDFLRTSALGAGALAMGGWRGALDGFAVRPPGDGAVVRIAFAGAHGQNHGVVLGLEEARRSAQLLGRRVELTDRHDRPLAIIADGDASECAQLASG